MSTPVIIDDTSPGFTVTSGWTHQSNGGYLTTYLTAPTGTGTLVATWAFGSLTPGTYQVSATWYAFSNRASNAPYAVYDGATLLATVPCNQQLPPSDFTEGGVGWKVLGTFAITGNTLTVTLTNAANQYVVADAIRIVSTAPPPPPTTFVDASTPPVVLTLYPPTTGTFYGIKDAAGNPLVITGVSP